MRLRRAPLTIVAAAAVGLMLAGCAGGGTAAEGDSDKVTLKLGSWRTEDLAVWQDTIIPAFEESHPNISVEFAPVSTDEYNAAITSQLEGGTGPDLITCRPYDVNRSWIEKGYFSKLDGQEALTSFDDNSLYPWTGADGSSYCVPVAAVLAGFYYNKDIFAELKLDVPTTQAEFISTLKAIKDDGKYEALAFGSADSWQLAYNGLYSVGPNYWQGEKGRLGLIDGTQKVTDPGFVEGIKAFESWKPYLPAGQASLKYADMTQSFALGKAAILPDGSWNINQVTANGINVGVFAPPVAKAGDQAYLQEQPDMAIGINAATTHKAEAEEFLSWIATPQFQELYSNAAPGFFAMGTEAVAYSNPLAQEFADLKKGRELTARLGLDQLSAGTPAFDDEAWRLLQLMMTTDTTSPEQVAADLQAGLASWYAPQQK